MKIVIDKDKWRLPCNRAPPRRHSEEKQKEIRKQVDALFETRSNKGVTSIRVESSPSCSQANTSQKWRFTLDFVRLNSATGPLEGWPIPSDQ